MNKIGDKGKFNTFKKVIKSIIKAILYIILTFIIFIIIIDDSDTEIVVIFLFLMLSGFIWIIRYSSRVRKKRKLIKEENIRNNNERAAFYKGKHIAGLPIHQNIPCDIEVYFDKLIIISSGTDFEIPMDRIINATKFNEEQIMQYQKTSMGKTILGGITFGAVGAIIGSMPQTKDKKVISERYLVVDYISNENIESSFVMLIETWVINEDAAEAINKYKKAQKIKKTL